MTDGLRGATQRGVELDGVQKERLLGLLGLARRAGRLAVGARAVEQLVRQGQRPLVILARDAGPTQRRRLLRLQPVRGFLADVLDRADMSGALGRRELVVAAVADEDFILGIERLGGGTAPRGEKDAK